MGLCVTLWPTARCIEYVYHFLSGQNHRQSKRPLRPDDILEPDKMLLKYALIENRMAESA